MSDQQHLEELVQVYQQRLQMLEMRLAKYGIDAPPHIMSEIGDLREQIAKLESQITPYNNITITSAPVELVQRIDIVNDNISRIESQLAAYTANTSNTSITNNYSLKDNNEYNIKLAGEYFKAIENFQSRVLLSMEEEIRSLREENVKLSSVVENLQSDIYRIREVISPKSFIDGKEEVEDEIRHRSLLRKELTKRLRVLELEQAKKGINTPAEVETQIVDLQDQITETEARIKILTFDLEKIVSIHRPLQTS